MESTIYTSSDHTAVGSRRQSLTRTHGQAQASDPLKTDMYAQKYRRTMPQNVLHWAED